MSDKTKAAMPGRQWYISKRIENDISTAISLVNLSRSAGAGNYGKSPQRLTVGGISPSVTAAMARFSTVLQICNSLIAGGMRHWSTPQSPNFSGDLQSAEKAADTWLAEKPADKPLISEIVRVFLGENIFHHRNAHIKPALSEISDFGNLRKADTNYVVLVKEDPHSNYYGVRINEFYIVVLKRLPYLVKGIFFCKPQNKFPIAIQPLDCSFFSRRRFISSCRAAMMNCDVLSSRFLNNSISSTTLCGTLACSFCDLELMFVVLTTEFSLVVQFTADTAAELTQPFGSMPRDCSSFLRTRFIQVARDESPSFFISVSSCTRSSCWSRIWYWSVFALSLDIVITKSILSAGGCNYNVTETVLQLLNTAKPRSARTLSGPLTSNVNRSNAMAKPQCNQTHPKFTWRFLALSASSRAVVCITATTEREARDQSPAGCVMVFAGRLPVQGVSHA